MKTRVGWCEWVGLPGLGVLALRAKVDTGAKTSSLHAVDIEEVTLKGVPSVTFTFYPIYKSKDCAMRLSAPIVDRRLVSDSGGHRQYRYVIAIELFFAHTTRVVEMTLANREEMKFRMLLGRQALDQVVVDAAEQFLIKRTREQLQFLKKMRSQFLPKADVKS
jgi:hypothetical protein